MPFRRRKIKRLTMGKDPVKHSHTVVTLQGNGSVVNVLGLIQTGAGDRSTDGAAKAIQQGSNTGKIVAVSDIIKYVNIILQGAVTAEGNNGNTSTQGWVEWAVVFRNETLVTVPTTNIGVQTLGDICSQMFRGDCLMSGQFPVSVNQPNVERIMLKLPKKANKWAIGSQLVLYTIFRDADTADLQTDTVKVVKSVHFKVYS